MRSALTRILLLLLSCFLAVGCERLTPKITQVSRTCNDLRLIADLGMSIGQPIEARQLRRWIMETYGIGYDEVAMETYKVNLGLNWKKDGVVYRISCSQNGEYLIPFDVRIGFDERKPSIAHLLQCLGWRDPDYYWASFGDELPYGKSYIFEAYFLDKGSVLFSGNHYLTKKDVEPPPLTVDLPMDGVVFVEPGPLEEIYRKVHHGNLFESAERPKTWPGWGKLEYVIRIRGFYPTQP